MIFFNNHNFFTRDNSPCHVKNAEEQPISLVRSRRMLMLSMMLDEDDDDILLLLYRHHLSIVHNNNFFFILDSMFMNI